MPLVPPPPPFKPDLRIGQRWYIKPKNSDTLLEYEILDLTKHTVEIRKYSPASNLAKATPFRYQIFDLKFIEKIEENNDNVQRCRS